ncbi:DUF3010 domain-containing protein [Vibrio sp. vnigr-6D03]|uniref:DUF3010 family protein n=1 Tax=Vibrio sp. vnigr-6D03 TaxID=2058088 RepID=UPI000C32014B|nr:DUF3010 family protein [Vibrio sp. vnigr-6D03]PKF81097.1 DUF3010 domain-containing protein [Vibrio sp. vnigr-6D03]
MRICGIELKGSEARLALVQKTAQGIDHVSIATKKIPLVDGECSVQVKSFKETFESFCRENLVDKVVIKKRGKKGEYAGGADTFKMEGIIQVSDAPNVILISPQSISSMQKKADIEIPDQLNKYQHTAYLASVVGADK